MPWPMPDLYADLVAGNHQIGLSASAYYGGAWTADLNVITGSVSSTYDGQMVRHSATLTVDSDEWRLAPVSPTSALAPYGQQVALSMALGVGRWELALPLGRMRIEEPRPEGGWVLHPGGWIPSGGTVSLTLVDLLQQVVDTEIVGLMQPLPGGTVASEIERLCAGLIPVSPDVAQSVAAARSVVYQESRIDALLSLAGLVGRVPVMSRSGVLELREVAIGTPSWHVTVDNASWISTDLDLTQQGIYNVAVCTGEDEGDESARVVGYALELEGPYAATSPLGPRVLRHSSPLYRTAAQATAGAATLLANRSAGRQVTFTAQATFNPAVDVLDTHRVTLRPGFDVDALVIGTSIPLLGGPMEITYSAPREAVLPWIIQ